MKIKHKLAILSALMIGATGASAQTVDNWTNSAGQPWKNNFGDCWRDANWTPATAHRECGALITPKKVEEVVKVTPEVIKNVVKEEPAKKPQIKKVEFKADTLFAFDKATLRPEGEKALAELVATIKAPGVQDIKTLVVVGHTDSIGTDAYNLALSKRRAITVLNFLARQGLDVGDMSAEGRGEREPVASNKTADGRAKNRRVEVLVNADVIAK